MRKWIVSLSALFVTVFFVAIAAFRWVANEREIVPYTVGLPEDGKLLKTAEGSFFIVEKGETKSPRVLFSHGTAAWSAIWQETMKDVSKGGYFATAFDMPPFGWSEHPERGDYSRSAQADRVIALLETLGDRPIVVAHSVGAGPVSEAILSRPDLVSGYVIVAGAIGLQDRDNPKRAPFVLRNGTIRRYLTAATATNPLLTRKFLRDFMYRKDVASPDVVTMLQQPMIRKNYTKAVSDWVPELFTTPSETLSMNPANWAALDLPVTLIWGAEDSVTPLEQGRTLASIIPNASLTVLDNVGHIPHLEAPSEFSNALLKTLPAMDRPFNQELEQK